LFKDSIILIFLLVTGYVSGQSFTEISTSIEENGVASISWGDYDNDNDPDVLIAGGSYSRIYDNKGSGVFTDISAGIGGIMMYAASGWGDYDNDGDLDFVLTGKPTDSTCLSFIFRNDNDGIFTDIQAELPGLGRGSAEWGDYDNDGDLDLLLCGEDEHRDATTRIYINEGNDRFSPADISLPGISMGSATWGDYDNDHDLDILICGRDISGNSISAVYRNDGKEFTDAGAKLFGVQNGNGIWGDYDSDGDLDIFITGNAYSKVYQNIDNSFFDINAEIPGLEFAKSYWGDFNQDGRLDLLVTGLHAGDDVAAIYRFNYSNGFTLYDSSFTGITDGDVKCADFDKDNDLDVILSGFKNNPRMEATNIYRNNGDIKNTAPGVPANLAAKTEGNSVILSWSRSSDIQTPAKGLSYNIRVGNTPMGIQVVSPMSDLSSGRRQIVSFGNASSDTSWIIKNLSPGTYYWSVQAIDKGYLASPFAKEAKFNIPDPFTVIADLDPLFRGSLAWGDYDNDNDLDLVICGCEDWDSYVFGCTKAILEVFRNDNNSAFKNVYSSPYGIYHSDVDWGDYDNDGDLDLLATGDQYSEADSLHNTRALIYKNTGQDNFEIIDPGFEGICEGSGFWADFDNDGDLDVLLSGKYYKSGKRNTYTNKSFIYPNQGHVDFEEIEIDLGTYGESYTIFADFDNDGDNDLIHIGNVVRLYKNSGDLTFEDAGMTLPVAKRGLAASGDYDNDGDLDLLIAGDGELVYTKLFNNDNGIYNETNDFFRGVILGSAGWGDYDVDGDLDVLLTGYSGRYISFIYRNERNANAFNELDAGLYGVYYGNAAWGDYNDDGDLDIAINGAGDEGIKTKIYNNNGNWQNLQPNTPDNLQYEIKGFDVLLKWDHCTDGDGHGGVTYNVRIDTVPGQGSITSVMSDLNTGYRLLPAPGNAGINNFYLIKNLPFNTYYWSVQAIDNTYKGGSWADESSFELGNVFVDFEYDTVCFGSPTTFTDLSLSREGSILSWHWDFGDGGVSNDRNPQYYFSQPGEKNVTLSIALSTGTYYKTKPVRVKPKPMVQFTFEPVSEGGEVMSFENQTDTFDIDVIEWEWDFGDSTGFVGKNPPQHGYLSTGNFIVQLSVTGSNGCSDIKSEEIQVCRGIPKKPELLAYGPNTWYLVCSNDTALFYKWYYNGSQLLEQDSYILVANKRLGQYQVAISSDDVCYVESDKVWIPVTGISSATTDESVRIYPNPNDGHFVIYTLNEDIVLHYYRLFDIFGREISSGKLNSETGKNHRFYFEDLMNGVYFVEILVDNCRIYVAKLIIKK
jgi:hypothetical protein